MALRINTLARGRSGVSLGTFNTLVALFNSGLTLSPSSQHITVTEVAVHVSLWTVTPDDCSV